MTQNFKLAQCDISNKRTLAAVNRLFSCVCLCFTCVCLLAHLPICPILSFFNNKDQCFWQFHRESRVLGKLSSNTKVNKLVNRL